MSTFKKCEFTKWITPQGCINSYKEKFICQKEAVTIKNGKHLCNYHAKLGRFVIREGDVGKIIFRCDTEEQLRNEFNKDIYLNKGLRMQKISRSHRRDIF